MLNPYAGLSYSQNPPNKNLVNQFCSNLTEFTDICKISQCIKTVNGLASNSVSNTDTWVVTFDKGVEYDGSPIEKGFIKLWLSYSCVEYKLNDVFLKNYTRVTQQGETEANRIKEERLLEIDSLNYEAKVYRDIIKDLVDSNICPNFIRFLGLGQNCSFTSVNGMLDSTLVNITNSQFAFYRNVISLIRENDENYRRPSTTDSQSIADYNNNGRQKAEDKTFATLETIKDNTTFTVLLNEAIKDGTKPFVYYCSGFLGNNGVQSTEHFAILFQIMAAIYAMSLSGLTHNDLHDENIWIEPCSLKDVSYVYGGHTFNFATRYVVKVFDFDRSYNKRLGYNEILKYYCDSSQCNRYIPNLDAMKIMGFVYRNGYKNVNNSQLPRPQTKKAQQIFLDLCTSNSITNVTGRNVSSRKLLESTWENGTNLIDSSGTALNQRDYQSFSSVIEIMVKCAKLAGITNQKTNKSTVENTYICNEQMFDTRGKILPRNIAKTNLLNTNLTIEKNKISDLNQQITTLDTNIVNEKDRSSRLNVENEKLRYNIDQETSRLNVEIQQLQKQIQRSKDEIRQLNESVLYNRKELEILNASKFIEDELKDNKIRELNELDELKDNQIRQLNDLVRNNREESERLNASKFLVDELKDNEILKKSSTQINTNLQTIKQLAYKIRMVQARNKIKVNKILKKSTQ